jgi:hypothetical protein
MDFPSRLIVDKSRVGYSYYHQLTNTLHLLPSTCANYHGFIRPSAIQ